MHNIIYILISNAIVTALLALMVWTISKACKRPQLMHMLWGLLLAKMLMPTMLQIPLPILQNYQGEPEAQAHAIISAEELYHFANGPEQLNTMASDTLEAPASEPKPSLSARVWDFSKSYYPYIIITGSLCWLFLGLWRLIRTNKQLGNASLAPKFIQTEAEDIACQINLKQQIEVLVWDAGISPMVWTFGGKPKIVLPARLFYSFSQSQQHAVLAHELIHLKRHDHWMRWLEFAVLTIYWWNPVAWWIVRQERQAEEASCDAQVTYHFPEKIKEYARALLQTVEYLAGTAREVPFGGSGLTNSKFLTRRIKMILNQKNTNGISSFTKLAVLLAALIVLPVSVGLAKDKSDTKKVSASKVIVVTSDGQTQEIDISAASDAKSITINIAEDGRVNINNPEKKLKRAKELNEVKETEINSQIITKTRDGKSPVDVDSSIRMFVNGKEVNLGNAADIDLNKFMDSTITLAGGNVVMSSKGDSIKAKSIEFDTLALMDEAMRDAIKIHASGKMIINGNEINLGEGVDIKIQSIIDQAMKAAGDADNNAKAAVGDIETIVKGFMIDADGKKTELDFDNNKGHAKIPILAKMFANGKEIDLDDHDKAMKMHAKIMEEQQKVKNMQHIEIKKLQIQLKEMQKQLEKLQLKEMQKYRK